MRHIGWILVAAIAALETLAGVAMLAGDRRATFASDTGISWRTISDAYPTVATQIEMITTSTLMGAAVVGALSLLIAVFALRAGQTWAWFALWLLPLYMLPGIVGLLAVEGQETWGYLGLSFAAVAGAGLLLSIPSVFRRAAQPANIR